MLGASNLQDMTRIRLEIESISTISIESSQQRTVLQNSFLNGLTAVNRRIAHVEEMLQNQSNWVQESQLEQVGFSYDMTPPRRVRPRIQADEDMTNIRQSEGVGFRATPFLMDCRPGCPCVCHFLDSLYFLPQSKMHLTWRLHEAAEAGVAPVALEINDFVDRILDQIFHHARGRKIILSSFTPEICILLAIKQQSYPVMFITNAGKLPASDLERRACSLQAAVKFSKRWKLAGIVFASDILLLCPRLVGYVKQSGFVCGSYGPLNNIPENVRVRQAAGVQLLMADRVGVVSMVLNEGQIH
ncbi:hypothetical protein N7540_004478 [Penicillium herquei]|nr:hypothetical protein N7540_004478 [Penicillium herquei]